MTTKLEVSQIFLPNYKQAVNFVSLYEETFGQERPVYLFLIIEIRGDKKLSVAKKQQEFAKTAQALVKNLKTTYLDERSITESAFEQALSNLNSELASLARRGLTSWYKRLNALVAVAHKDTLSLSTTGDISGYLLRDKEFTHISENLSPVQAPPVKSFVNFATGTLEKNDRLIFSTSNFFNYVSLEKLRQLLRAKDLSGASRELVATLKTDAAPADAFAGFICAAEATFAIPDTELAPLISPASRVLLEEKEPLSQPRKHTLTFYLKTLLKAAWVPFSLMFAAVRFGIRKILSKHPASFAGARAHHNSRFGRKEYLYAFLLIAALLVINLIYLNIRNSQKQTQANTRRLLDESVQALTEAEAALIYNDENRARGTLAAADERIALAKKTNLFEKEVSELAEKITKLSNQLNKIAAVTAVEHVAAFSQTPDRLIKMPNGFLGFNSFTESFELYDTTANQSKAIPPAFPILDNLVAGEYVPAYEAIVFASANGRFYRLNPASETVEPLFATSSPPTTNSEVVSLRLYESRAYAIDKATNQILRFAVLPQGFSASEAWLKQTVNFSEAKDLAVDGNIYVLAGGTLQKFTRGEVQPFSLPNLKTGVGAAIKIVTDKSQQNIHLLDPANSRIVILTKQGKLAAQLISERFADAKDMWVDEKGKTMYVLLGNELVKFKY